MPPSEDAWSDIPKGSPLGGRTERRADPNHPLDFFRARDEKGHYLLVLKGDDLPATGKLPILAGLRISLAHHEDKKDELVLELADSEQLSIFRALVADILQATSDVPAGDSEVGLRRVIGRIERWQELLKRKKSEVLTRQAIIGLVGELLFLRDSVMPRLQPHVAVTSWRGSHRDEQDFAIGRWIAEVKTQLSTADQFIKISSEAQLDTTSGPIALVHQTISSVSETDPAAVTLNGLVASIRSQLLASGPAAIDIFEAGLIAAGYEARPEYEEESWLPITRRIFEIAEGFPRLVPAILPPGVQNVSYRVLPNACSDFERSETWLNSTVLDAE